MRAFYFWLINKKICMYKASKIPCTYICLFIIVYLNIHIILYNVYSCIYKYTIYGKLQKAQTILVHPKCEIVMVPFNWPFFLTFTIAPFKVIALIFFTWSLVSDLLLIALSKVIILPTIAIISIVVTLSCS